MGRSYLNSMPVLITGAAAAAAHRLSRILGDSQVIFADQQDLPGALFSKTKFIQIPSGGSPSFAHQLLTLCLDHAIDVVFPLRREELKPLAESKRLFEEYNIDLIIPDHDQLTVLLETGTSAGEEFVIAKDGMILSGQFLDMSDLPSPTGLFICPEENYAELKLFTID